MYPSGSRINERLQMRCVLISPLSQNLAIRLAVVAILLAGLAAAPAGAQQTADTSSEVPRQPPASSPVLPPPRANQYSSNEIIDAGHHFFGGISRGLASIVEKAVSQWGLPNGYILGQEASGAFIGGLRYGEGTLYTRNAGDVRVFWQGPSLGIDYGADGARTMMLVYNLPQTDAIFDRFGGVAGSAYFVAGLGMTELSSADGHMVVVPIRSGLGLRLGANFGYLKFTESPTWNPF
jgi:hypothetical protein